MRYDDFVNLKGAKPVIIPHLVTSMLVHIVNNLNYETIFMAVGDLVADFTRMHNEATNASATSCRPKNKQGVYQKVIHLFIFIESKINYTCTKPMCSQRL